MQAVGDRCFQEGLFEPARAVFAHIPAWGRLASTLVRLHQFQAAVDAARKANSPKTWKEVRSRPHMSIPIPCLCLILARPDRVQAASDAARRANPRMAWKKVNFGAGLSDSSLPYKRTCRIACRGRGRPTVNDASRNA